jgi:transposase-like protein
MAINTSLAERIQIMEQSQAGEPVWKLARRLGWRPSTIRKWRQRGRQQGRAGLVSVMGRPRGGALSSFAAEIRETVLRWRQAHPGWGPKTLRAELAVHPVLSEQRLPSAATIGRWLKTQGLTHPPQRHQALPASERQTAQRPHEVWELDACGYQQVPEVGYISLIHLNDRVSHLRLLRYPCWLGTQHAQRRPTTPDYQLALRLAFLEWGLPLRLQVDHDSVFYDNTSASPFPTRFHLWLVALGIGLTFGRPHRPTDQGMTERAHRLWSAQVLEGQTFATWHALEAALRTRRTFLNGQLPCATLANQPPLVAYPHARQSGRPYRPEWEPDLLDLRRVAAYLTQGRWFRRISSIGTVSLGAHRYTLGTRFKHHQTEITFDARDDHLQFSDEAGHLIARQPLQNLSLDALMGDLLPLTFCPALQLALPLTSHEHRLLRLCEIAPATTL